jgi:putative iron-dependent peroxidase
MTALPLQPSILAAVPPAARYLSFRLVPDADPRASLARLANLIHGLDMVVGIGGLTAARLGAQIPGLREAPRFDGASVPIPSQPKALWCWLRGEDRGDLLHRGRRITQAIAEAFTLDGITDAFRHGTGRDLTGYEDGTENPRGEDAIEAALVSGQGPGLDGSSHVAVQSWLHNLRRFERFAPNEQDAIMGRRREDNEELEDAPESAHVKRTAQESFAPEAFLVRRSMPWIEGNDSGLMFVAFGRSFDAFEAQLRRMVGLADGITDALFRFTRPVSTSYFWCPPLAENGHLDLRALGL